MVQPTLILSSPLSMDITIQVMAIDSSATGKLISSKKIS